MTDSSRIVRALGFAEARMHYMHALFAGTTQCVAALGIHGPLDEVRLQAAVDDVAVRHEILGCSIEEVDGIPMFARVPARRGHLTVADVDDWRAAFQAENSKVLPLDQSPWMVKALRDPDQADRWELMLIVHHTLMDGHGIDRILRELLERYEARLASRAAEPARPPRPVPPPVESMLPRTLSWADFRAHQARLAAAQPKLAVDRHREPAALERRQTRTLFIPMDGDRTARVDRAAAAKDVRFNSWVAAALLRAMGEQAPHRTLFGLGSAFSLRPLCDGLAEDDLGCNISVVSTFHEDPARRPIEESAREYGRLLTRAILEYVRHPSTVDPGDLHRSMQPLANIESFVHDIGYTYAETALRRSYGDIAVEHFFATANRSLGSSALVLHGVRHEGAVYFTINYTSPVQSDALIAGVADSFTRALGA